MPFIFQFAVWCFLIWRIIYRVVFLKVAGSDDEDDGGEEEEKNSQKKK
jgi:hypothetical protein